MFIIESKPPENPSAKLTVMLEGLKKTFGQIPPHFEMLGSISPEILENTLASIMRLMQHPHIHPDLFPFIRLHVAGREGYDYCIRFNSNLLKMKGYPEDTIARTMSDIREVPFERKEKELAAKAIKAIYDPRDFGREDLKNMYELGWNDKDIFDAIDHAGFLLKNGRIISCYLE